MSAISPVEQRAEPRKQFRPSRRQQVAIMLFTITGPLLALDHWQNGGRITFFGAVPITKLFLVACIGGAASFTLYADRAQRWIAPVAGALAGFGAFGIHLVYTTLFERESMWNIESILIAGVGALPGILLLWAAVKVSKRKEQPL